MRAVPALFFALLLAGCAPKSEPETTTAASAPTSSTQSGGVAPMTSGAAGGMTPVAGAESVDGAGMGGVGSAAKDMARGAAAKAPGGSSMPAGDNGE